MDQSITLSFRPAVRENTPLVVGLAGPTKSGKTLSALRLATGLAQGGTVAMINAEGPRGHQYADRFKYLACDLSAPFTPKKYLDALAEVKKIKPASLIVDSMSHMHDGPGGFIEMHEEIAERMSGGDKAKKERVTWAAWIEPKRLENEFIYSMLELSCPVILCFRAKEKLKIVPGKQPIDLGWQPICSDRITFETLFTLVLEPHAKGVPSLNISDMREPFDTMVKAEPINEDLGRRLIAWSKGAETKKETKKDGIIIADWELVLKEAPDAAQLQALWAECQAACKKAKDRDAREALLKVKDARKKALGL
jgi:hypothetical protein